MREEKEEEEEEVEALKEEVAEEREIEEGLAESEVNPSNVGIDRNKSGLFSDITYFSSRKLLWGILPNLNR